MAKFRVYEIAKKYNKDNKEILEILKANHVEVKNHMSTIGDEQIKMIENALKPKKEAKQDHNSKKQENSKRKDNKKAQNMEKKNNKKTQEVKNNKNNSRNKNNDGDKKILRKDNPQNSQKFGKNNKKNKKFNNKNQNQNQEHKKKKKTSGPGAFIKPEPVKKPEVDPNAPVKIPPVLTLKELADALSIPANDIIKKLLISGAGMLNVNSELDFEKAEEIAMEFDRLVEMEEQVDVIEELLKEEEEDEEDPRAELVRRLLEYKMYKYMSYELKDKMDDAANVFFKEPTLPDEVLQYREPVDPKELLAGLTLEKLNAIYKSIIRRQEDKVDPIRSKFGTIEKEEVSLSDKMIEIKDFARTHRKFSFRNLLESQCSKVQVIVTFLSILELMKMGHIHVEQDGLFDDISVEVQTDPDTWKNLTEFAEDEP